MDKRIEGIVKAFEYDKIHKLMETLDWFWCDSQTDSKVPSIGELVLHSVTLMENILKEVEERGIFRLSLASGGFQVNYDDGFMTLQFVAEEWVEAP